MEGLFTLDQGPGQFLFVEISAPGTDLRASMKYADGAEPIVMRLPYIRSAPRFVCGPLSSKQQAVQLRVDVIQTLGTQPIDIVAYEATNDSRSARRRNEALSALCNGLKEVDGEEIADWNESLDALKFAHEGLRVSGENRLSQWAQYFHAYFLYYPLSRYDQAIAEISTVLDRLEAGRDVNLNILALQLLGQASVVGDSDDSDSEALTKLATATTAFQDARTLSKQVGNRYEEIWALNNLALAYYNQSQYSLAKSALDEAYELVILTPDDYLISLTQSNRALALEKLGDIDDALKQLEDVGTRQNETTDPADRVHNLHERGRILIRLERYSEAILSLLQALELAEANPQAHDIGRIQAFLGQAYREIGNFERSDFFLDQALPWLRKADFRRGIRDACGLIADNARQFLNFERLETARECQLGVSPTDPEKARWHYARALDGLAAQTPGAAIEHLLEAQELAYVSAQQTTGNLARLQECVIRIESGLPPLCQSAEIAELAASISQQEAPRTVIDAKWLWARSLALDGRHSAALEVTTQLVDQVLAFRAMLPGVLGAWFWERSADLLRFHMDLVLTADAEQASPLQTLVVLDRLLNIEVDREPVIEEMAEFVKGVRELKVRIDDFQASNDAIAQQRAATRVEQSYISLAGLAKATGKEWTVEGLSEALGRAGSSQSVLAYYFSKSEIHIWSGSGGEIKKTRLEMPSDFQELLSQTRVNLRLAYSPELSGQLARLGELLVGPVKSDLGEEVFILATGALTGIPMDGLIVDGQPLVANHDMVNVMRLEAVAANRNSTSMDFSNTRVFLAGAPLLEASGLPELAHSDTEIANLAALFPERNRAVHIRETLTADAFRDTSFLDADIIHISSHAEMNTRFPEISKIQLSTNSLSGQAYLTPADFSGVSLNARLAVFSSCNTVAYEGFALDTGLGFLSSVFRAGVDEAIVSLWPVSDRFAADAMQRFYQSLQRQGNTAKALSQTKRELFAEEGLPGISDWAAFQIYKQ